MTLRELWIDEALSVAGCRAVTESATGANHAAVRTDDCDVWPARYKDDRMLVRVHPERGRFEVIRHVCEAHAGVRGALHGPTVGNLGDAENSKFSILHLPADPNRI